MSNGHDPSSRSLARPSRGRPSADPAGDAGTAGGAVAPDPLSDVLRTVRLSGALFFLWDVSWPFVTPVPAGDTFSAILLPGAQQIISYHVVIEGTCWGALIGGPPVQLHPGDVLLVPHGDAYAIASSQRGCAGAAVDVERARAFFRQMREGRLPLVVREGGGSDTSTRLVCGFLGCDPHPFNPLLSALPPLLRVPCPSAPAPDRLRPLVDFALAEARAPGAGGHGVLVRLSELMFIEVVRRFVVQGEHVAQGWLAGLRHPVVSGALALLHRNPAAPWTLDALAAQTHVSRSRLARTFAGVVGLPPMQYLTRWRLQLAARRLAGSTAKVGAIAREVGYDSEAAFSRAFKRFAGVSPARWRRGGGLR